MNHSPTSSRPKPILVFAALALLGMTGAHAALTITNGTMDAAGDPLSGWTNVGLGGFESKEADGDLFGAMVKNLEASGFTGTTVGSTDNDWAGVVAGQTISVDFDLFAHSPGNATDTLVELLIDGAPVSGRTVLEADLTPARVRYSLPDYTVEASDIGKQVDVRFNTGVGSADAADWHQTGIDNVSVTVNPVPTEEIGSIALDPTATFPSPEDAVVLSSAPIGARLGTLSAINLNGELLAEGLVFSLVAGTGDTDNGSYSIGGPSGDALLVAASLAGLDDVMHSVRIRAENADGPFEMALTFVVKLDADDDDLIDAWETMFGALADFASGADSDSDGLVDEDEFVRGTDPSDDDSDGDGVTDGEEVAAGTDPNDPASFNAPLEFLNGDMNSLATWTNVAAGGLERKDTAGDFFGALVFNLVGAGTTVGATNDDWNGVSAGQIIGVDFDLFAHSFGNAADMRIELLIEGAPVSSLEVLENSLTDTRVQYALPDYTIEASDIGKQVDVRFTATAGEADWHQTGIDNVAVSVNPSQGPPVPFAITDIALTVDGPMITFNSSLGETYGVERSTDLAGWLELTDDLPEGGATSTSTSYTDSLFDSDFPDGTPRVYYRVKLIQ